MRTLKGYIPITRRLLGQYLMFGLASIAALGAGLIAVSLSSPAQVHDDIVLDLLDDTADAVAKDLVETSGRNVQRLVDQAVIAGELQFCAVIATDGRYSVHSARDLVGKPSNTVVPGGTAEYVVERRHVSRRGQAHLLEYSKPIIVRGKPAGAVQMGIMTFPTGAWSQRLLDYAPTAMLVPFLCLWIGGKVITGSLRTNSAVEERLAHASSLPDEATVSLLPVDADGPVAAGWNRLTRHLQSARPSSLLEQRLESALGGVRDKRCEQALQALPEGIAMTDADGNILQANPALCALLGIELDAAREKPLLDLLPWAGVNDEPHVRADFDEYSRRVVAEFRRGADLSDGVLRVARYPLEGTDGSAASHVWLVRDVTQQKLAEEAREQFVYSATHELRTPLANIRAYAETLSLNEFDDEDQRKGFLNTINLEATRLGKFVDELLNISQMEAGSLSLHPQKTDVRRMLAEVVDKVRAQIEQKGQAFDIAMPAKLPELMLDKDNIIAALVNVLGNAAKYTPEGGRVGLRVEQDDTAIQIHVEDTGYGISPEELPKLGRKFFRSADPRVQDATGTGLGLAFTHEVVRLHGGKLTITSELNKGSRFTITVPVR